MRDSRRKLPWGGGGLVVILLGFFMLFWGRTVLAGDAIGTELVARASNPTYVTAAPGLSDHLFVAERNGVVRALDLTTGEFLSPFTLDIRRNTLTGGERGLLGLTFHPNFQENGQFFVYVSEEEFAPGFNHASYVRRYEVDPENPFVADPTTETTVLRFNQPQGNHNAGWIDFSPVDPADNLLYVSTGDGGNGNDLGPNHTSGIGNAQDITDNFLGKILRVNVDGDDFADDPNRNYAVPPDNPFVGAEGDDEIFAYGLRNPFRNGFDRANGDLYIADVGQNNWEEIDFLPAGSGGGQNFGWRLREGFHPTPTPPGSPVGGPRPADNVDPIHEYDHMGGARSVTGGTVYRGPVLELQGKYIFTDFVTNQIWAFHYDGTSVGDVENLTQVLAPDSGSLDGIVAFGEDAVGDMYIVELDGEIWRIAGPAAVGDFNRDAVVNRGDLQVLLANLGTMDGALPETGNTDGDSDVDGDDLLNYLLAFGTSALDVPAGSSSVVAGASPAVPEPGTCGLVLMAAGLLGVAARQPSRGCHT